MSSVVTLISVEQHDDCTRGLVVIDGAAKAFTFKPPIDDDKLDDEARAILHEIAMVAMKGRRWK